MAENRQALPPLRDVIARHGLGARHSLGQHFLLDQNLTDKIARNAGDLSEGTVVEIGPGPGGLTRSLLGQGAAHLLAVELDQRCISALEELQVVWPGHLTIVHADAMKTDLDELRRAHGLPGPVRVVANLPYNVSTALLIRWLEDLRPFAGFTLMFQKEVADRLTARPREKSYGRLSVLTQWLTEVERLFTLPAAAFTPPPKVASAVVRLTPRPAPLAPAPMGAFERVTAAAFGQRRKMLRASLKSLGDPAALLDAAGIDGTRRAEELSIEEFAALARALAGTGG